MKIIKDDIFPTRLFAVDNLLEDEYVDSMLEDTFNQQKEKDRINWQSGPKLQNMPKYKALSEAVLKISALYMDEYQYEYDKLYITDMWSNVLKPGEFHRPHTHSNNIISGVYYLQSDDSSAIQFVDPRPQAGVLVPNQKEFSRINSSIWFYPSVKNRAIFFPSWLQHWVPKNNTKSDRVSIAFNVMLKGKVGLSENYQSAEF